MTSIDIGAPMRGWVGPLDEVPDPVFAERMMGDGIAIDPLVGEVRAPCDARVLAVAATRHSVTLELANGAQLLIHVGLETVGLGGEGFVAHIAAGALVARGDLLITFDLDAVAQRAKSLITPVVVINDGFEIVPGVVGRVVEAGETMFSVRSTAAVSAPPAAPETVATELVMPLKHGIHARPAARIVATLKPFAADITLTAHGQSASARSIVALLGLGVAQGDHVQIGGAGPDAAAAIGALVALIDGLEERDDGLSSAAPAPATARSLDAVPPHEAARGICASPGGAVGPVAQLRAAEIDVPEHGEGAPAESRRLDAAFAELSASLVVLTRGRGGEIFTAHLALLEDPGLRGEAAVHIGAGASAGRAWRNATRTAAKILRDTGDARLGERVADLIDLERQLLASLYGEAPPAAIPAGSILIADDLLPSQFMALDAAAIAGICTARGGPTAHVAILAASAGVPMLVAAGPTVLDIPDGQTVVLDATAGMLDTAPSPETIAVAHARLAAASTRRAAEAAAAHQLCVTADGTRIEIFANLASAADGRAAVAAGAEGCGLLRTEFLFHDRATAPDEAEQRAAYAEIAASLEGRPLIVRTLDSGGDKPVAYLPMPHEDNPALGVRGIRLGLARPELLAAQFRAILRGVPAEQCRIMLPMIVDVAEFRRVRAIFDAARADVGAGPVALGVMIETPAAALMADSLAAEADFLSIGSNDLTQYALAADRDNPALAPMIDPLHPAVLRLIAAAAAGARRHNRWIGVCGGVASDPAAAAILIGLGVTELSATPAAVPAVKATVRSLRLDDCRALAARALAAESAAAVRALVAG